MIRSLLLSLALIGTCTVPAAATGTFLIQLKGESPQRYPGSTIHYTRKPSTLTVISPDGKGVIRVDQAACFVVGKIWRCLLTKMSYDSADGVSHPIDLADGVAYANLTSDVQPLPYSSQQLPPGGVLLSINTKIGTYMSLVGTIDGEIK